MTLIPELQFHLSSVLLEIILHSSPPLNSCSSCWQSFALSRTTQWFAMRFDLRNGWASRPWASWTIIRRRRRRRTVSDSDQWTSHGLVGDRVTPSAVISAAVKFVKFNLCTQIPGQPDQPKGHEERQWQQQQQPQWRYSIRLAVMVSDFLNVTGYRIHSHLITDSTSLIELAKGINRTIYGPSEEAAERRAKEAI